MKTLITLSLLIIFTSGSAEARWLTWKKPTTKIAIMSDVDDTVRPTGTLHFRRSVEVALGIKKTRALAGMSELYRQILLAAGSNPAKDEYFVSGSPLTFSFPLDDYLKDNGFSAEHVKVRFGGPLRDIAKFKQGAFEEILKDHKKTKFIFLGDDTEKDAISMGWARDHFPNQILAVYVHSIEGVQPANPADGQIPYYTAVEVALHEFKSGRLSVEQVAIVAQAILDETEFGEHVIPPYARLCPADGWISGLITRLGISLPAATLDKVGDIQTRVHAVCAAERRPEKYDQEYVPAVGSEDLIRRYTQ